MRRVIVVAGIVALGLAAFAVMSAADGGGERDGYRYATSEIEALLLEQPRVKSVVCHKIEAGAWAQRWRCRVEMVGRATPGKVTVRSRPDGTITSFGVGAPAIAVVGE
jgi:hypothetical protein